MMCIGERGKAVVVVLSILTAGCWINLPDVPDAPPAVTPQAQSAAPAPQATPRSISDGAHQPGNPHFYFLAPLVPQPNPGGVFLPDLSPVVELGKLTRDTNGDGVADACGLDAAGHVVTVAPPFTMTSGPGSETIRVETDSYVVNWHTDGFDLEAGARYRIRVLVGGLVLGHADVLVGSSSAELKNVDTSELIPLKDGRTLPIAFRIEEGALSYVGSDGGEVELAGGAVSIEVPEGALSGSVQFSAGPVVGLSEAAMTRARLVPGGVYDFGPPGPFLQPIRLSMSYEGDGTDLTLVTGQEVGEDETGKLYRWTDLPSTVDTDAKTVSAWVTHFTPVGKAAKVASIQVYADSTSLGVGDPAVRLTAQLFDDTDSPVFDRTANWFDSPPNVVTVVDQGIGPDGWPIADVSADPSVTTTTTATVEAREQNVSGSCTLEVVGPDVVGPKAQWARTLSADGPNAYFTSVGVDGAGNIYAAGSCTAGTTYDFGNGVTAATGATLNTTSVLLVKYNSSGQAQWAQTLSAGDNYAAFNSMAVDATGNTYATGWASGTGTYDFGNGITATGTSTGMNVLLVKYNPSGQAQWARTVTAGDGSSMFTGVAVDALGNTYVTGGLQVLAGTYGFGNDVTATGSYVLVKYDSFGEAQWARTVTGASGGSGWWAVALDGTGNIYVAGICDGGITYDFGNGVTARGATFGNGLLVKYDSSGQAQWARTLTAGSGVVCYTALALDASGGAYASGWSTGSGSYGFGNGVTATGTAAFGSNNTLVVKYDSSGQALWAQTLTAGSGDAELRGAAVDGTGNLCVAGVTRGTLTYGFGNGVTAAGTAGGNVLLVVYSSSGQALAARTLTQGWGGGAGFSDVAVDGSGNIDAVGGIVGSSTVGFGSGVTAPAIGGVLVVQYR